MELKEFEDEDEMGEVSDVTNDNPDVEPDNANGGPKGPGTPKPDPKPQPGTDPKPDPTKPQPAAPKPTAERQCARCQRVGQVANCSQCAELAKTQPKVKPAATSNPQPNGTAMRYWCENCQARGEQDMNCFQCAALAETIRGPKPAAPSTNGHASTNGQAIPTVHEWGNAIGGPRRVLSQIMTLQGEPIRTPFEKAQDERVREIGGHLDDAMKLGKKLCEEMQKEHK
jgi:hypothetical protein